MRLQQWIMKTASQRCSTKGKTGDAYKKCVRKYLIELNEDARDRKRGAAARGEREARERNFALTGPRKRRKRRR